LTTSCASTDLLCVCVCVYRFTSATLAELIKFYPQAWRTASSRPGANICTVQYDFERYYRERINPIKGFTKTKNDKATVQAWQAMRATTGLVHVKWKPEARLNTEYLGVDSTPSSEGFIVLRNTTSLAPISVEPQFLTEYVKKAGMIQRDISSDAIREQLVAEGLEDSIPWLLECSTTGRIPIQRVIEQTVPHGEIGRLVEIGTAARCVKVRAMDLPPPGTADEFFALPVAVSDRLRARRQVVREGAPVAMPNLGYRYVQRLPAVMGAPNGVVLSPADLRKAQKKAAKEAAKAAKAATKKATAAKQKAAKQKAAAERKKALAEKKAAKEKESAAKKAAKKKVTAAKQKATADKEEATAARKATAKKAPPAAISKQRKVSGKRRTPPTEKPGQNKKKRLKSSSPPFAMRLAVESI
jgi:hypothetical protein